MLDLLHAYAQGVNMEIVSARKQNVWTHGEALTWISSLK